MINKLIVSGAVLVLFCSSGVVQAQETLTPQQQEVVKAIEKLSVSTAPGGGGADAYGAMLAEDFSRWTVGSTILNGKKAFVESIREWFDDGWRVTDRQSENLEILIAGDFAFTRRLVHETYKDPEGETSSSKAALAETWVHKKEGWLLYRVHVHPIVES